MDDSRVNHGAAVREMVRGFVGDVDPSGVEIGRLVRTVCNLYETRIDDALREQGLSGPRWGLLLRMLAEEQRGHTGGMSPTHLSRCQNVSKNTISSLIGGLEEQGLVERELDRGGQARIPNPPDRRGAASSCAQPRPSILRISTRWPARLTGDERAND